MLKTAGSEVEDYITTVYRLEEVYGVARTVQVARELGVTPATASKMLEVIEKRGLAVRTKYRGVRLTDDGRRAAEEIIRRHRVAEAFLSKLIGMDLVSSHVYAHKFEHMPDEIVQRIFELIGRPTRCPHGNPIPGAEAEAEGGVMRLSDVEADEYVVVRLAGELLEPLKEAVRAGLEPGAKVRVIERSRDKLKLEVAGREVTIPRRTAETIFVAR
ncbi:MAG: metal-dependent transcriptional regulator [Fervidicoccaceae archaeon]